MRNLNLNQRKALSELINNLSISLIIIGIITPIFSKDYLVGFSLIRVILVIIFSSMFVFISNNLLK